MLRSVFQYVLKILKRFRFELLLFASLEGLLFAFGRLALSETKQAIRVFLFLLLLLSSFALLLSLRYLWKNKWKEKLLKASKRSLARLSGIVRSFLLQIFSRLNLNRGFDTNRISGETSIFFDSLDTDRALRSRIKTVKWKKTQSSRERLRLLYRYMIRNKVKDGMRVSSTDTPEEILRQGEHEELETELFQLYVGARYDERILPPEDRINVIKANYERKWSIK